MEIFFCGRDMKILGNLCRLYWGEQHRCTT